MKQLLLGTTALFGAAFIAGSAMAEAPRVSVGGFIDFQAGMVDEDLDTNRSDYEFRNDTEIHFSIDGKSDNGLGYGAVIELEADVTGDPDGEGLNSDRTFIYLEGGWGRFELGANQGVTRTMSVDAATFARATGGVDGDFYHFINPATFAPGFIVRPDLLLDHGSPTTGQSGLTEDQNKVVYYSPRFNGFQFGAHFIPDTGDVGNPGLGFSGSNNAGQAENVFGAGLNYSGQFDNVGIVVSAVGETGSAEAAGQDDYQAYDLGLNLSYMGFTVGGSWGDFEDAFAAPGASFDANYWTLGAGYDFGAFGASVTYLDSELANNDFQNISVGLDYMLAPGLVPYIEASFFEFDQAGTGGIENDGTVVLLGTELSF